MFSIRAVSVCREVCEIYINKCNDIHEKTTRFWLAENELISYVAKL